MCKYDWMKEFDEFKEKIALMGMSDERDEAEFVWLTEKLNEYEVLIRIIMGEKLNDKGYEI